VTCEHIRESISAALDGEPAPVPEEDLRAHLQGCAHCRRWAAEVTAQHRRSRIAPALPVPDLTVRILEAVQADSARRRPAPREILGRAALAAVGLWQLVAAGPELFLGHDFNAPLHTAHEIGSFSVAVAIGLLLAAWHPRLAAGMLPIVGIIAALLLLTAGTDLALGRTQLVDEAPHLLDVAGFLLLTWLSGVTRDVRPSSYVGRPSLRPSGPVVPPAPQ
jgi:predicted anti-sigma-YlaC factor YlaD